MKNISTNNQLSKKTLAEACQILSSLGHIHVRSQFGGYALCSHKVMFGLVSDGHLYIRSNHKLVKYFDSNQYEKFIYTKRGIPITLEYYKITELLLQNKNKLLEIAEKALYGAQYDKEAIQILKKNRIKDLPNLNISLERVLWKLGIKTVDELKKFGAIKTYILLHKANNTYSKKTLFALDGAINGCHSVRIPEPRKKELLEWLNNYLINKNT